MADDQLSTSPSRPHPGTAHPARPLPAGTRHPRPPRTGAGARHWWRGPGGWRSRIRPSYRARHRSRRTPQWETTYQHRLLVADLAVGMAAGGIAFAGRFGAGAAAAGNRIYLLVSAAFPLVFVAALAASRAYERRHLFVGTEEYQRVIRAGLWLTATAAVVSYALNVPLARGWLGIVLPAATVACLVERFAIRRQLHHARLRGERLRRVIVVGHEKGMVDLAARLHRDRFHGMTVVGACLPPGHTADIDLPVYGTFDDVAKAVEAASADTVIVLGCPELDGIALRRLAWQLEPGDIDLILANSLIDVAGGRTTVRPVDGLPLLHVEHPRLAGGARVVKELVDRAGAALLLVLSAPLLAAVAVGVRLDSPGPVLFRQVRTGQGRREFTIYKFRTMYVDAETRLDQIGHLNEHDGVLFKIRNDPRVTPVGRWLRRFSLDELPQLVNVLLGQMSLVGPRPPLPSEVAAYPEDVHRRLAVKPGITGLWQVSGRSDLSWEETVRLDLRYVENWSLALDLVIMLRTMTAVFRGSGAY